MVRFQRLAFIMLLFVVSFGASAAAASGEWYFHDDPELVWYWHKDPYFEIALPLAPASFGSRSVFGEEYLRFY